jgi:sugar phosphate isomerase/epimerase
MLGKGVCEIQKVIDLVRDAPMFNGWLVVEEESADAAANPEQAVKTNRETLRRYSI